MRALWAKARYISQHIRSVRQYLADCVQGLKEVRDLDEAELQAFWCSSLPRKLSVFGLEFAQFWRNSNDIRTEKHRKILW